MINVIIFIKLNLFLFVIGYTIVTIVLLQKIIGNYNLFFIKCHCLVFSLCFFIQNDEWLVCS